MSHVPGKVLIVDHEPFFQKLLRMAGRRVDTGLR
jgi:hypothetical protein